MNEILLHVEYINKRRKSSKNKWYYDTTIINNHSVSIKGYNTWLQIFRVDGLNYSGQMDIKVGEYKKYLLDILTETCLEKGAIKEWKPQKLEKSKQ